ncbi:Tfx family DNA-binding protein [Desulfurococcaceae archaeon MEX13E-LK6-19]|nr:Tfx family DNA-binding protein [Desulfurococcaceae archaeon MEX13E-LK6-19]
MSTSNDTLLTSLQVKILKMKAEGLTFDEIARRLGVSKSSVYTVYKNAIHNIEKARNTLRLYAEIFGGIEVSIPKNTPINNIVSIILREADIHGIKINRSSSSILLYLFKKARECFNLDDEVLSCGLKIRITLDGNLEVVEKQL